MAYEIAWYHEFYDIGKTIHRIDILEKDYSGGAIRIDYSDANPVRLIYQGSKKDFEKTIIQGQQLVFTFHSSRADVDTFDALFEADYKDYKVKYYIGGVLEFEGYVKPENLSKQYVKNPPYIIISLSATDGLADLKDEDFVDLTGNPINDRMVMLEVVKHALAPLGIDLDIQVQLGTFESDFMVASDCALKEIIIDTRRFFEDKTGRRVYMSCWKVLEVVLQNFNCTLKQNKGKYQILNPYEKDSYQFLYDWATLTEQSRAETSNVLDISAYQFDPYIEQQKVNPLDKVGITFRNKDLGGDATGLDLDDWGNAAVWTIDFSGSYTVSNGTVILLSNDNTYDEHMITAAFSVSKVTENDYLKVTFEHIVAFYDMPGGEFEDLIPDFLAKVTVIRPDSTEVYMSFYNALSWQPFESGMLPTFKIVEPGEYRIKVSFNVGRDPYITARFKVKDFKIAGVINPSEEEYHSEVAYDKYYEQRSDKGIEVFEVTTLLADADQVSEIGAMLYDDGGVIKLTTAWRTYGHSEDIKLLDIYARNILNNRYEYKNYLRKVKISDRGNNIGFNNILTIQSRDYIFISYTRDSRNCFVIADLVELLTTQESYSPLYQTTLNSIDGERVGNSTSVDPIPPHAGLAELQGGQTGQYYHFNYSEYTELHGWLDNVTLDTDGKTTLPKLLVENLTDGYLPYLDDNSADPCLVDSPIHTDGIDVWIGESSIAADLTVYGAGSYANYLTLHADPANALHAVPKQYADGLADDVKAFVNYADSPMIISGGEITEGTNAGTFKVAALTAILRATDSSIGDLTYVTLSEQDNQAITLANTIYFIVLNYNGGSPTISLSETNPYTSDKRNIPIGKVIKNDGNEIHWISGGFHLQDGVLNLHIRARTLRNLELVSGSRIAYSGTNNFTMTSAIVYSGIDKFTSGSYNSADTQFTAIYQDGNSGWTEVLQNTIDYEHYDDGDGTLGNISPARYGAFWVYKHVDDDHVFVLYGRGSYKLAAAETAEESSKPDYLTEFGLLIGKIIAPQVGGSFTVIQMVTDTFFSGTAVADHNQLATLQGGTADEYYHFTSAEHTNIGSLIDNSIVDALHRHSELVASDGDPDPALSIDAAGNVNIVVGSLTVATIASEAADVDKFLVSNSGLIKYRTGAEVLSDIGAAAVNTIKAVDATNISAVEFTRSDDSVFIISFGHVHTEYALITQLVTQLSDLSDVGSTTPTDKNALMADGDSWESRALVEADISDFGNYATSGANTNITSLQNTALYVGRDSDNKIDWGTDDHLKITIAGALTDVVSISTGNGDNDKLVTQGYVDDAISGEDFWDRAGTTIEPKTANDNLDMGSGNLLTTGDVGADGSRITKGWFTDLECTNAIVGSITGNAATATALQNARTIGGISFDGTANIVPTTIVVADESSDTTCFVAFFTAASGNLLPKTGTNLTFNSADGILTATSFSGANVTSGVDPGHTHSAPAVHASTHEVGGSDLVNHDDLTNYAANEHIDHTTITFTAGDGLTGGGTIADNRTFTLGTPGTLDNSSSNAVTATSHTHAITNGVISSGTTNQLTVTGSRYAIGGAAEFNIITAAVADEETALATGDQIYDFVIALGYSTTVGTVTEITAGDGMDFVSVTASGAVTMGTPATLTSATSNAVTATSHTHAITTGIGDTNIVRVDHASVADNDYAKFTADGLEGRNVAEVLSDLGLTNPVESVDATNISAVVFTHSDDTESVVSFGHVHTEYRLSTQETVLSGDVSGSGTIAITTTIGANKVLDSHINWGTGATQVSAVDMPIADGGGIITATEVEGALQENRTAIDLNTAKDTNVTTNLSLGTVTATTMDVNSSDGTNATLIAATTNDAGLLTASKFDEIVANTAKTISNVAYNATSWDGNSDAATKNAIRDKIEAMDVIIAGKGDVLYTSVALDATDVGNLGGVITLLVAPGANKMYMVISIYLELNVATQLEVGTQELVISQDGQATGIFEVPTSVVENPADRLYNIPMSPDINQKSLTNTALTIRLSDGAGPSSGSATMIFHIAFRVIDINL